MATRAAVASVPPVRLEETEVNVEVANLVLDIIHQTLGQCAPDFERLDTVEHLSYHNSNVLGL